MSFRKLLIIVSMSNMILLLYTAWIKYGQDCTTCNLISTLPISDVYIALSGAATSMAFAILTVLSDKVKIFTYFKVIIAVVCAIVASYLQAYQLTSGNTFCYYCLAAAILFYLIFVLNVIEHVIKPTLKKNNELIIN